MIIHFTGVVKSRKHRVHMWINTDSLEPLYGIQSNLSYGVWAHVVGADRSPILFDTKVKAQALIKSWATP